MDTLPTEIKEMIVSHLPAKDCVNLALTSRILYEASSTMLRAYKVMNDVKTYYAKNLNCARYRTDQNIEYDCIVSFTLLGIKASNANPEEFEYTRLSIRGGPKKDHIFRDLIKNGVRFLRGINTLSRIDIPIKKTKIEEMFAEEEIDLGERMMRLAVLNLINDDVSKEVSMFRLSEELIALVKNKLEKENKWYEESCAKELTDAIRSGRLGAGKNVPGKNNGPSMMH
ncbi:hypothetical protein RLOatenuis_8380 [Rickettsiales bacterium]|nr:hypothetical protein RLOatenuis_8380 [Rickettsiales bacterium]